MAETVAENSLEAIADAVFKDIFETRCEVGAEADVDAVSEGFSDVLSGSGAETICVEVFGLSFSEAKFKAMDENFAEAWAEAGNVHCRVVPKAPDLFVFDFDDPDDLRRRLYRPKVVVGTFSFREYVSLTISNAKR